MTFPRLSKFSWMRLKLPIKQLIIFLRAHSYPGKLMCPLVPSGTTAMDFQKKKAFDKVSPLLLYQRSVALFPGYLFCFTDRFVYSFTNIIL
jgi:hypothetical protein